MTHKEETSINNNATCKLPLLLAMKQWR